MNTLYKTTKRILGGHGWFKHAGKLDSWARKHARKNVAVVNGRTMFLGEDDPLGLSLGNYEPLTTKLIQAAIDPTDICVDLGANIGYYTLLMAGLATQGHVYAFEPDPKTFDILKRNVEISGLNNITLVQAAISDKAGKATLHLGYNPGSNRLFAEHKPEYMTGETIEVDTIALDDYFKDKTINLLKMDIEGCEPLAVNGGKELLKRSSPVIFSEIKNVCETGYTNESFADLLRSLGFNKIQGIHDTQGLVDRINTHNIIAYKQ